MSYNLHVILSIGIYYLFLTSCHTVDRIYILHRINRLSSISMISTCISCTGSWVGDC